MNCVEKKIKKFSYRKCHICNIRQKPNSGVFLARFPSDTYYCRLWVQAVGDTDLLHIPVEQLHLKRFVCGNHFSDGAFGKSRKMLRKTAIPKIALLKPPLEDELLKNFPPNIEILPTRRFIKPDPICKKLIETCRCAVQSTVCPGDKAAESSSLSNKKNKEQIENEVLPADSDSYAMDEHDFEETIEINPQDEDVEFIDELRLEKDPEKRVHSDFKCNVCEGDIVGFRYVCVQCADWDMCAACEARGEHPAHYVLRLPAPKPRAECEPVIAAIREQISHLLLLGKEIKSEVYVTEVTNIDEMTEEFDPNLPGPFSVANDGIVPELRMHQESATVENVADLLKAAESNMDSQGDEQIVSGQGSATIVNIADVVKDGTSSVASNIDSPSLSVHQITTRHKSTNIVNKAVVVKDITLPAESNMVSPCQGVQQLVTRHTSANIVNKAVVVKDVTSPVESHMDSTSTSVQRKDAQCKTVNLPVKRFYIIGGKSRSNPKKYIVKEFRNRTIQAETNTYSYEHKTK